MNGYFPQGENISHPTKFPDKLKFYADLQNLLETRFTQEDALVVMGDFNISPEDCDIGIGEHNAKRWLKTGKCSFQPQEFFFSSRRRHTRCGRDWSSDVCSSD